MKLRDTYARRTQAGRDLVWLLTCPSMIRHPAAVDTSWGLSELQRNPGLVAQLDAHDPTLRLAIKARKTHRLGEYFEILLRTWLDRTPPVELLASGLQIHGDEGTIGEFDLVFRRDQRLFHWEIAVKFYLGYQSHDSPPCWFGPNPRDRLNLKWRKMLDRQLRLAEHPHAQRALMSLGAQDRPTPAAFVRGYLFDSVDPANRVAIPDHVNPNTPRGWWVHRRALTDYLDQLDAPELRWMTVSKLRWLSPVVVGKRDKLCPPERLPDILPPGRSHLVAGLLKTPQGWRERTRGFVVPDYWPQHPHSPPN